MQSKEMNGDEDEAAYVDAFFLPGGILDPEQEDKANNDRDDEPFFIPPLPAASNPWNAGVETPLPSLEKSWLGPRQLTPASVLSSSSHGQKQPSLPIPSGPPHPSIMFPEPNLTSEGSKNEASRKLLEKRPPPGFGSVDGVGPARVEDGASRHLQTSTSDHGNDTDSHTFNEQNDTSSTSIVNGVEGSSGAIAETIGTGGERRQSAKDARGAAAQTSMTKGAISDSTDASSQLKQTRTNHLSVDEPADTLLQRTTDSDDITSSSVAQDGPTASLPSTPHSEHKSQENEFLFQSKSSFDKIKEQKADDRSRGLRTSGSEESVGRMARSTRNRQFHSDSTEVNNQKVSKDGSHKSVSQDDILKPSKDSSSKRTLDSRRGKKRDSGKSEHASEKATPEDTHASSSPQALEEFLNTCISCCLLLFDVLYRIFRWGMDLSEAAQPVACNLLSGARQTVVRLAKLLALFAHGLQHVMLYFIAEVDDNVKDGSMLCYLALYSTPITCDWLMNSLSLPFYVPHFLSASFVFYICSVSIGASRETRRRSKKPPDRLAANLCILIRRGLCILLPLELLVDGFDDVNTTYMMLASEYRLILAYTLSVLKSCLILSPVAWVSWALQVLIAVNFPLFVGLDVFLLFFGCASIWLVKKLQAGDVQTKKELAKKA